MSAALCCGCYTGLDGEDSLGGADAGAMPGGDTDGDGTDGNGDDPVDQDYEPAPAAIRLLLSDQYVESIRYLLGEDAAAAAHPPEDTALNGFDAIGATQLALTDHEIDVYEGSARDVAAAAMGNTARIAELRGCEPTDTLDEACHRQFVENFGRLAFRRPLEAIEVDQYTAVAQGAAADFDSFEAGIEVAIAAMLQSPYFLYQVEVGEPQPDRPEILRLTGMEMASRLSFFLLGRTPDAELLDDAEAGMLDDAAGVQAAAEAMMQQVEARDALVKFGAEMLRLHELDAVPKDPALFPGWNEDLVASMREETLMLIEHIAWDEGGDFRAIFDAPYTFVDATLAAHYGIEGEFGEKFARVDLPPDTKRGGILGHAGLLSVHAHVTSTSPTLRGKFVRESLLCQTIPAPPPEVATDLPTGETQTLRERLEQHMSDPACSGCHALMDPIGFGLENFDSVGAFRTLDNGQPVDATSELNGVPFEGAAELGAILKEDEGVPECLVRNLYRHATGHLETNSELEQLEAVAATFAADGFIIQDALVELVSSQAFRVMAAPK